ncbi:unnamed protein product [Phytophthora fragariaefolia]|uniref:Unnamed protein product n=1 Tax=Phytophthora fragariaefolia TaxID=1490495 RepID=A0A9W6YME8_9STRA|nr:unnamed protein product [Phytophthora fragariaefolia]
MAAHAVHHHRDTNDIGQNGAHAASESRTSSFLQSGDQAHRQHRQHHDDTPRGLAEGIGEEVVEQCASEHKVNTRDQQTRAHLRERTQPAAPLAHAPLSEVAERFDRVRGEQQHLGHGDGRVDIGKGHESHGDDSDGRAGACEVTRHAECTNAVDTAEEVEGRLGILEGEEGLFGHGGVDGA